MEYMFLIILLVFMIGMMFVQTRRARSQQRERDNFWKTLEPGTEVITIGGVIGKVVEVDEQYEEIVLDTDGSLMRFSFKAVNRTYVRPAYVSDDEVDEQGNPIESAPQNESADDQTQPAVIEQTTTTITETAEPEVQEADTQTHSAK